MKYYVYAGYYENFISGHKLPKPYTLRDEFKTFDEALDYVLENWEDDAIFFTEDVIDDAIDNGFINDEDWEDYLMEESKKSARKSMKEFNEDINNTAYFDRVAGELHSWYVCYVEDYERKYEYGFKNEKECINWIKKNGFDLDPSMNESKKSARKSMKEQFVGKGKGGYRKPDKTKFNSGICLDSNGVKHTVIFDTHVEDFIVWVDDDNYLMWYVSSPQSLLNNLAESDLDENLILDIVALWEKLPKKHIKN